MSLEEDLEIDQYMVVFILGLFQDAVVVEVSSYKLSVMINKGLVILEVDLSLWF